MAKPVFQISYDLEKLATNFEELNLAELKRNGEDPDNPLVWKPSPELLPYAASPDAEEYEQGEQEMECTDEYTPADSSWTAEVSRPPILPGYTTQSRWFGPGVTAETKPIILEELASVLQQIGIKLISAAPSADANYYLLYPNIHMSLMAPGVLESGRPLPPCLAPAEAPKPPAAPTPDPSKESPPAPRQPVPAPAERSPTGPILDDEDVRAVLWASGIRVVEKKTDKTAILKPCALGWMIDDWLQVDIGAETDVAEIFKKMLAKTPSRKLMMYKYIPLEVIQQMVPF
uniref:Phosphprotein n=1 Tax=Monopterus albus rhabdovirus TaxID=1407609 RepID=U5U0L3_9RHAB|nr:phosphprotein [Monopterus albus rhabdovirus]